MANTGNKITSYSACNTPTANDVLIGVGNSANTTFKYTVGTLTSFVANNLNVNNVTVNASGLAASPAITTLGPALEYLITLVIELEERVTELESAP